jgi:hypothetical protein
MEKIKHNWVEIFPGGVRDECNNCGMISFVKEGERFLNMNLNGLNHNEDVPSCEEFKSIVKTRNLKKNCQRSFENLNCTSDCRPFDHIEKYDS